MCEGFQSSEKIIKKLDFQFSIINFNLLIIGFALIIIPLSFSQAIAFSLFYSSPLNGELKKRSKSICNIKLLSNKKVAVLKFSSMSNNPSLMGSYIAEKMQTYITEFSKNKFTLIDRLDIAKLIDEIEVHGKDDFDIDKWAKKLSADYIVTGDYNVFPKSKKIDLQIRVISPEKGVLLYSDHINCNLTDEELRIYNTPPPTKAFAPIEDIKNSETKKGKYLKLYKEEHGKKFPLNGDAPTLSVGDTIGFSISPPMDSKIYVFNYDPQGGELIFLYPLSVLHPMVFQKHRVYFFPDVIDKNALSYPVKPPLGRMCLKVIGIKKDVPIDLTDGIEAKYGYFIMKSDDIKRLITKLSILPKSSWWEDGFDFWIIK